MSDPDSSERVDVVVIGAGISGLAAALGAQRAGATVRVLEASDRVGGVVRTSHANGFLVEHGPNSFAANDASMTLLRELGIADDVLQPSPAAKRRYVVKQGALLPLPQSPPALLQSKLLSVRGRIRALAEVLVRKGGGDEESLASLVRRRFGHEILDYFIDPFVSGVYAGDPEQLSSRYAMRMLSEMEAHYGSVVRGAIGAARARKKSGATGSAQPHSISFKHGLQQLPLAFAKALGTSITLRAPVVRVAQARDAWAVTFGDGTSVRTVHAASLVVSVPAHALQHIEWPATMREKLTVLSGVPHASVATVAVAFPRENIAHALDGFGMLVPFVEHRAILGALFNSTLFPGRAPASQTLLTVFLGGARNALGTDAEVMRASLSELPALLGIHGPPTFSNLTRWENGIPQFVLGHGHVLTAATSIEHSHRGLFLTGSYLRGVSLGDCIANGLADGARAASSRNSP